MRRTSSFAVSIEFHSCIYRTTPRAASGPTGATYSEIPAVRLTFWVRGAIRRVLLNPREPFGIYQQRFNHGTHRCKKLFAKRRAHHPRLGILRSGSGPGVGSGGTLSRHLFGAGSCRAGVRGPHDSRNNCSALSSHLSGAARARGSVTDHSRRAADATYSVISV